MLAYLERGFAIVILNRSNKVGRALLGGGGNRSSAQVRAADAKAVAICQLSRLQDDHSYVCQGRDQDGCECHYHHTRSIYEAFVLHGHAKCVG